MSDGAGRAAYPDLDAGVSREVLAQLDEAATCSEHWKILITAGMGFFTDAYDLFIIGVAATMITAKWHIAGYQKSLLSSLALLTSAAGAIVFGRIADRLGRRKVYGYEVLILAAGAIASACSRASGGSSPSAGSSVSASAVTTRSARRS
jgi:MFS transporter, PHS family, inorganic phosphate transporter